jgi:hypothetical protein
MALPAHSGPWPLIQFRNHFSQTVGLLGRVISSSQGRYLHRTTQAQNKRTQTSMPCVGFEPTIPLSERAKKVHASDCAATVTGSIACIITNIGLDRITSRPNLLYYPRICLEGLWGNMKSLSQDGFCPRRDINMGPTECKVRSVTASANLTRFSVALFPKSE